MLVGILVRMLRLMDQVEEEVAAVEVVVDEEEVEDVEVEAEEALDTPLAVEVEVEEDTIINVIPTIPATSMKLSWMTC